MFHNRPAYLASAIFALLLLAAGRLVLVAPQSVQAGPAAAAFSLCFWSIRQIRVIRGSSVLLV
ncbi:MAG: hypothetical protein WA040_12375 [Anaerolineae bacterium]